MEQTCKDCDETKPVDMFFLASNSKPMKHCKECHRERVRLWRIANPERTKASSRRSYEKRGEEARTYALEYRNRPGFRANRDAWEFANADKRRAYQKVYRDGAGRWKLIERKYGLTREAYEAMEASQNGCCAICLLSLAEVRIHIDHCHTTNVVRGLLCSKCNQALGLLQESADNASRARAYLTGG